MRRGDFSVFVIDLAHPLRWHEEVYRRGLAGGSGHFVFEVVAETEGGALVVLCARQRAGCSLRLAYAVAHPERGSWRLGRRGLPEGYIAPPPTPPLPTDDYYAAALRDQIRQGIDGLLSPRLAGS